jgi:hypothetical protein
MITLFPKLFPSNATEPSASTLLIKSSDTLAVISVPLIVAMVVRDCPMAAALLLTVNEGVIGT